VRGGLRNAYPTHGGVVPPRDCWWFRWQVRCMQRCKLIVLMLSPFGTMSQLRLLLLPPFPSVSNHVEAAPVQFFTATGHVLIGRPCNKFKPRSSASRNQELLSSSSSAVLYSPASTDATIRHHQSRRVALVLALILCCFAIEISLFAFAWSNSASCVACAPYVAGRTCTSTRVPVVLGDRQPHPARRAPHHTNTGMSLSCMAPMTTPPSRMCTCPRAHLRSSKPTWSLTWRCTLC
jgi:hypothetical protein